MYLLLSKNSNKSSFQLSAVMMTCLFHSAHPFLHVVTHLLAMLAETTVNWTVEVAMVTEVWLVALHVMIMTIMINHYNGCIVAVIVSHFWFATCECCCRTQYCHYCC